MKNSCSKGSPGAVEKQRTRLNQRQKARLLLIFSVAFLAVTAILGVVLHDAAMVKMCIRDSFCAVKAEMKYVSFGKKHVKYKSMNKHEEECK